MNIPLVDLKAQHTTLKKEIDSAISDVIDNSSFIMGPHVKEFENNWAEFCGTKHAIGCSNGTSAVELALRGIGIGAGDDVITVPNTFIATTESITNVGANVKFVDVEEKTQLIDIDALEKSISPNTKAVIVVHLFGQMPDMERIKNIAEKNNLKIIEDAAQAHAAEWNGHQPGYYGDAATFSFFPAKNLGCFGDAGAVITNNDEIAKKIRLIINHGRINKYEHLVEGFNHRMDALQASILNVKLKYLNEWTKRRRNNAKRYNKQLSDNIIKPFEVDNAKHSYYMYVIRSKKRDNLMEYLKDKGISSGIHYPIHLHEQPAYKRLGHQAQDFPISHMLSREILSIPIYPELTDEQINFIIKTINEWCEK